ncbi:MAG: hypothetical protein HQM09_18245 [Candidatus Riflebacteria bacterium]|nr:hypothetical protein [Candidatus Riflebacteria bacterium]
MNRFSLLVTLLCALVLSFLPMSPIIGEEDWMKQLEKTLKSQLQQSLIERFIRYDNQKKVVSFSPDFLAMATNKARKNFGDNLQTLDIKPEGNTLNFSLALKNGMHLSGRIEPEALEFGLEEMTIVGRLPQGLKLEGVDLQKTVSGFFDNLFGVSPSSATYSVNEAPARPSPSGNVTEILKNFSVEGNTFRLKRPWKASALGRALSSGMSKNTDGKTTSISQRLALNMENGWLNLSLGDLNPEKVLLQFTTEHLLKQLQGK